MQKDPRRTLLGDSHDLCVSALQGNSEDPFALIHQTNAQDLCKRNVSRKSCKFWRLDSVQGPFQPTGSLHNYPWEEPTDFLTFPHIFVWVLVFDSVSRSRSRPLLPAPPLRQLCPTLSFIHTIFHTPSLSHTIFTHNFVTHSLSHTIFVTQICHTPSFTHLLCHTTLSHTNLSHTIFHTPPLSHNFVTHKFVTHHLSHTIFHTPPLSHNFVTHKFVTHHLSHTIFHTPPLSHNFVTHHLCHTPSFTHLLCHTTLSHTIFVTHHLSHTIFHTPPLSHNFVTHKFVTHHLSHTIFHTPPLSHKFVTHHLSHTIFHTPPLSHNFVTHKFVTHSLSHTIFHATPLCVAGVALGDIYLRRGTRAARPKISTLRGPKGAPTARTPLSVDALLGNISMVSGKLRSYISRLAAQ